MQTTPEHTDYKVLYEDLQIKYTSLLLEIAQLKKMMYGSRHERFIAAQNNPAQLTLDVQAEQTTQCRITDVKKITYTRVQSDVTVTKEHPGRMKLPQHLERREIIVEPTEDITGCKKIGEEITEELEYEPGKLYVNKIVRPKYAKPDNGGIVTAPMPERPLQAQGCWRKLSLINMQIICRFTARQNVLKEKAYKYLTVLSPIG
jgi:transposase